LLTKAVRRIARIVTRVKAAGAATRTRCPDHSRAAAPRARQIASKLRLRGAKDEAQRVVRQATAALAGLAEASAADARAVLRNARRGLTTATGRQAGQLRRAVNDLATTVEVTAVVAAQARSRLAGVLPDSATRVVSLHDRDARPIVRGRLGRPVEFGYKAQVVDNTDGVIVDYTVEQGNPADAPQLAPAIARVTRRAGRPPSAVTADRGYGEARVEADLHALGVRTVVIPRKGQPGPARRHVEHRPSFRTLVKWRAGCEGRIAHVKRRSG
jgi:IS5 family transposase